MRSFYKILFLFALVNFNSSLAYSSNIVKVNESLKAIASPSGQITGNATVCLNATQPPLIKFEVKDDNNDPYTFTYTINGVVQTPISTAGNNKSVTLPAPTDVAGTFIYILTGIKDKDNKDIPVDNGKNTVTINIIPSFTVNAGTDILVCKGSPINLNSTVVGNGSNTVSYSWSGPNGFTNNQQSPSIANATAAMSGNYTVTASIGSCSVQDVVKVDVAEPKITDVNGNSILNFSKCNTTGSQATVLFNLAIPSYESNIIKYTINWGDTTSGDYTSASNPISHIYSIGSFTMSVQMFLNNGCSATKQFPVFIGSSPSPATLQLLPNMSDGCAPHTTQWYLNIPKANVAGTTYFFNWGDTSVFTYIQGDPPPTDWVIDSQTATSITYLITKIYTQTSCGKNVIVGGVTYYNVYQPTVVTQNPCSTTPQPSGTGIISVSTGPTASFTPNPLPSKICVGQVLQLNNTSDFGFTIPISSGSTCINTAPFYWTISPATAGAWTATGLGSNNGDLNDQTNWTIGSITPTITFNVSGTYTITLRVKNSCGDSTTLPVTICVEAPLVPTFTISPTEGCTPLLVTTANTTNIAGLLCTPPTYQWNITYVSGYCGTTPSYTLLNGTTLTSFAPEFNFINPGTYSISLTTISTICSPVTSPIQKVIVKQPPTVTINPIAPLCQSLPTTTVNPIATVINCGTQSPLTYEWSFPSGFPSSSSAVNPGPILYNTSGTFPFSLKVTNECGSTTANSSFTINPSPTITGTLFSCINSTSQLTGSATAAATSPWTSSLIGVATVSPTGLVIGVSAGTTTITYTNSNGCKTTALFTVNPTPIVTFSIPNQTICSGETSSIVTLSSVPGATFNWTAVQPTGISGVILNGTNTIPSQTLVNSTNANIIVIYNATATLASGATCAGAVFPYTITVKPKPFIAAIMTATTCSGLPFNVTPTNGAGNSVPIGTSYSWIAPVVTGGITGGIGGSNQTSISGTLTNPTNVVQTATYKVTPSFNGCSGLPFDVVVSVNPKPDVNVTPNVTLCTGEVSTQIDFTGTVIGTTYNWASSSTPSIGIAVSGTNTIPSFTAINTGTTPVIATITVTPLATTCTGSAKTFTITVNPKPTVNLIANFVRCNGIASGIIPLTGNVSGTTFDWTNDTPSIGLAAAGSGNIPSFTSTNIGLTPVIATLTVTPKANGCIGTPITFTITVNPSPTVDVLSNQTVCNGQQTTAILFSGAILNTTYNWDNNSPAIGIGASGLGDISAFTAINNGTSPIVAIITVTPNLNGCPGSQKTFTITINPSPAVTFTSANQTLCSGSSSNLVNLSSTASGATFAWTAVQPAGITGVIVSGTNTIPAQTLTNSTNLPIVITYLATAESNSGVSCQGITYPYTITVNPIPSVTSTQSQTICSNTTFSIIPLDGSGNIVPAGTTYSWGIPIVTGGVSGGVASANQNSITGTLINPSDTIQTATYTVTPKSGSCAGNTFTVIITINPLPKIIFSGSNQTICCNGDSLPIILSSPATGTITFNWNANVPAGITGATASGTDTIPTQTLVNTTTNPLTIIYTATATFENNGVSCTGPPYEYKITVNPAIITSSISSNYSGFNVSSVGASDGAINVTVTGGSGIYTYIWSGPNGFSSTSQDISNVPAGAYSLTINDGLCNPLILYFTLTSPMPLIIQEDLAAHLDIFCFGYLTGAIKVDITQQSVGPYDYVLTLQGGGTISSLIDSAATNYTFTGLAAGVYDLKVTDANGSVKTILGIIITQPTGIIASISTSINVACSGDATGSATVIASGGIGTLTYSWNSNPIQTTATATGLTAGTYTVTITDANTCSIQKQVIITEPNGIITSIASQTNVLCFGNNTGSATVLVSGGTGVLNYSWDSIPVQTTAIVTGLTAGTYHLTVTDANGCLKVQEVIISEPSAGLSSTISNSTNVSCSGGNNGNSTVAASGGTAPYSYSWNTVPVQTLATATGLKAGNYTVSISDVNGCSTSTSVTITEPIGMTASITAQTNVFCSGNSTGSATVTANGGTLPYTYSWNTTPVQTLDVAVNLPIGTYTVTITDAKGCTTTTQAAITEPNGIVTSIASQTNVDCFGNSTGAVSISASGGAGTLSYSWDTTPVQTTPSLVGLIAGTYNLTVTDANNCTKVQNVIITEPDDIVITTDIEKDITCFNAANGEIKIAITGGTLIYNIAWTKNGTAFATSEDLSNLSPGIYAVTVSDANNCGPKTVTFTITEPPILAITLASQTNILCFGQATGAITVTIVGGTAPYLYAWTGPNGFTSSSQNLTNVFAGTYNLVVTDNLGCTKTLPVTLTQPTAIIITATTTPIICYGANNASISIVISGGIAPYAITWSNLGSGTFQDNLSAGDYLITVTDALNCVNSLNVNIPEAPIFTINPVVKNITCFGDKNGSINLNIVGGIAPVTLVWDDSAVAGNVRNNLGPGSYTVTITDGKPCTIRRTFILLEPQLLVLQGNITNAFDCTNANSGAINLLVSGGSSPYTYSWSNGVTTEDLVNITAGNYLVTVKDANGCSQQAQYSVNRPPPIVVGMETKTDFNCETKYVKQTFVAKVSGGVPPYQLIWSSGTVSGPNNEFMNTSQNGTVILNATDAIGCKSSYTFNVALPVLGSASFTASSYANSTYGTYSINDPIQFTSTATGDYISVIWDFGDGSVSSDLNPVHTYINPKEYVVTQTVTYPLGCVYVQRITFIVEKGYVLVVPTAFTSNNDSLNDTFRPVTKGLKKVRLDIYDTWGSMIYSESGDVIKGWDGKIKGNNSENGNYYCKVSGETFYGIIINENTPFVLLK
jgi:gliding motility-associated-like protein